MTRHELREHIFRLLFLLEFHDSEEMNVQEEFYFTHMTEAKDMDLLYIREKYRKIKENLPKIDDMLNHAAQGWKLNRMGKVELTILRLAVYEMKYDEEIPTSVAINEAVELGKKFSGEDAPAFINGVLAKLA